MPQSSRKDPTTRKSIIACRASSACQALTAGFRIICVYVPRAVEFIESTSPLGAHMWDLCCARHFAYSFVMLPAMMLLDILPVCRACPGTAASRRAHGAARKVLLQPADGPRRTQPLVLQQGRLLPYAGQVRTWPMVGDAPGRRQIHSPFPGKSSRSIATIRTAALTPRAAPLGASSAKCGVLLRARRRDMIGAPVIARAFTRQSIAKAIFRKNGRTPGPSPLNRRW